MSKHATTGKPGLTCNEVYVVNNVGFVIDLHGRWGELLTKRWIYNS